MEKYLLKREEIEAMEGLRKSHFLNPDAQRTNKSLGDLTGLTGIGFHLIHVPPGKLSTEYHVHHYEDECTYVLCGSGTATIGSRSANDPADGVVIVAASGRLSMGRSTCRARAACRSGARTSPRARAPVRRR